MNGCQWQDKSFSVVMDKPGTVICRECGCPTDGVYKYNGDDFCKQCFGLKGNHKETDFGNFNTTKDKAYEFTTEIFDGKPVDIHSRGQFKKLLKKHGLADASIKECHQEADFRKRLNNEDDKIQRRKTAENIYYKMKQRGQLSGRK